MGKRKQRQSDCVCDHPGHCVCIPPTAMTWVPDTRPRVDNPDPNAATMLDIELAARFRQLVELAETDPHLPGRLREAVDEWKAEARAELASVEAELEDVKVELEEVKAEWYEPSRYNEDTETLKGQVSELQAKLDNMTDELADFRLDNERLRGLVNMVQADGC